MDWGFFIYAFVALFVVVNPVTNVPVFAAILERFKPKHRKQMVKTAAFAAFSILLVFSSLGGYLLNYLSVELSSFRIAGGILLFIIGLEMLFGQQSRTEIHPNTVKDAKERESVSISPLATPLLTGPGAITTGVVLFQSTTAFFQQMLFILASIAVFVSAYVILIQADFIGKKIGKPGMRAMTRVMGLVLAAIAVNMTIAGIKAAFGL